MIEKEIDELLVRATVENWSPEARSNLMLAKAVLTAIGQRLVHIDGLTAFTGEIKKLTREVRLLTEQITYLRGRL